MKVCLGLNSLFMTLVLSCAFSAQAVELCEPLSASSNRDEIGGVHNSHLQERVEHLMTAMPQEGWVKLSDSARSYPQNSCTRIHFVPRSTVFLYENMYGHSMRDFLRALIIEKAPIMEFYKESAESQRIEISDQVYNRLAYLAVGILGAESRSGQSFTYYAEYALAQSQVLESMAYCLTRRSRAACTAYHVTSRGPTQIKNIPEVGELYGIDRDNLSQPYFSGVATMGFLIETYKWFLRLIENKDYHYTLSDDPENLIPITADDFEIFLTYMYRGDLREIINSTATPDKNCYLKRVLIFQEYITMFVHPEKDCRSYEDSILLQDQ